MANLVIAVKPEGTAEELQASRYLGTKIRSELWQLTCLEHGMSAFAKVKVSNKSVKIADACCVAFSELLAKKIKGLMTTP